MMDLAYDERGARGGRTLLFLHGLTNSNQTYREVLERLGEPRIHIINADLRGHGRSTWADSYRVSDYSADVVDLLDTVEADAVTAVGHSLGGLVVSHLAGTYPERVDALFLEDPALYQGDPVERATDPSIANMPALADQLRGWQEGDASIAEIAQEYGESASPYPAMTMLDLQSEERIQSRVEAYLQCDPAAVEATFDGTLWEGFDPETPISCRVKVLAADPTLDAMFLPRHFDRYTAVVPHAQIVSVEGAAHSIRLTEDGLNVYMEALRSFLESL